MFRSGPRQRCFLLECVLTRMCSLHTHMRSLHTKMCSPHTHRYASNAAPGVANVAAGHERYISAPGILESRLCSDFLQDSV